MTASRDANNVPTTTAYDALGRPTLVTAASGTGDESQTSFEYSDQDRYVITTSSLAGTLDGPITIQRFDPLGRIRLHQLLDSGPGTGTAYKTDETVGTKVQTSYQYSGTNSYQVVSNPYKTGTEPSMGWTRTMADAAGRAVETRTFPGLARPYPWNGTAGDAGTGSVATVYGAKSAAGLAAGSVARSTVKVTDQAGITRTTVSDALGRTVQVMEDGDGSKTLRVTRTAWRTR